MVYQASVVGLLRTILIIIAVYYIIKFLARIFAPKMMQYAAKKMQEKMQDQFREQQEFNQAQSTKEPITKKKSTEKVGEYIDFEEID